jgi:hypothetical protein
MGKTTLTALVAAALVGLTVLTIAAPAEAGRGGYGRGYNGGRYVQNNYYRGGYGRYHHHDGWNAVGAGLLGFGVGAIVGSALTPREVVVAPPPPPPPTYYTPATYGPPAWTATRATGASIRTPVRLSATTASSVSAASLS